MRNFEADKLVRIGDVARLLESADNSKGTYHTIYLGDAGDIEVDCPERGLDLDVDSFFGELIAIADRT